jgi:hypothetical protein
MVLFQKYVRRFDPSTKMAPTAELSLTKEPMGNSHKNLLVWNQSLNWNQTLSRALPPRSPPQCSCVVIESSFDPGERLQAPGSLWFFVTVHREISPTSVQ